MRSNNSNDEPDFVQDFPPPPKMQNTNSQTEKSDFVRTTVNFFTRLFGGHLSDVDERRVLRALERRRAVSDFEAERRRTREAFARDNIDCARRLLPGFSDWYVSCNFARSGLCTASELFQCRRPLQLVPAGEEHPLRVWQDVETGELLTVEGDQQRLRLVHQVVTNLFVPTMNSFGLDHCGRHPADRLHWMMTVVTNMPNPALYCPPINGCTSLVQLFLTVENLDAFIRVGALAAGARYIEVQARSINPNHDHNSCYECYLLRYIQTNANERNVQAFMALRALNFCR
jgi:hypothetical protein